MYYKISCFIFRSLYRTVQLGGYLLFAPYISAANARVGDIHAASRIRCRSEREMEPELERGLGLLLGLRFPMADVAMADVVPPILNLAALSSELEYI